MSGFVDSQTWEAWFESLEVFWDNTSYIFIISICLSLVLVLATWMLPIGFLGTENAASSEGYEELKSDMSESTNSSENQMEGKRKFIDTKTAERRALEKEMEVQMTLEQKREEREAQSQQLEAIFRMMQEQEDKFGKTSIGDIQDQMKLYSG
ncbi:hypothetical protein SK128_012962 [Halocaridina rubra]|uniref:Matrix-remodeling-associated protein 7 helical domain-containing protein n=1 Tax=Halocaridina rubra TaxID=373956 RepID=A0AAN8XM02_HALRR